MLAASEGHKTTEPRTGLVKGDFFVVIKNQQVAYTFSSLRAKTAARIEKRLSEKYVISHLKYQFIRFFRAKF